MKGYLHIMDLAFSYESSSEDPLTLEQLPQIIEAVKQRLLTIGEEADLEAFGHLETGETHESEG